MVLCTSGSPHSSQNSHLLLYPSLWLQIPEVSSHFYHYQRLWLRYFLLFISSIAEKRLEPFMSFGNLCVHAYTHVHAYTCTCTYMYTFRSDFVVCECSRFKELSLLDGSCIEVVAERQQLEGFKVAVVKNWALNRTR